MNEHRNTVPVLPGFWSDPTICRAGDDFYLAHSSFEYFPGAPVHHSTDLLTWRQIGHVITRPEQSDLVAGGLAKGIYGSTIRHHDGRFWFITTNVNQAMEGLQLFVADDPAGPWSDPVLVPVLGIDPDLAWDDDGTCILTWCGFPSGISQVAIDPATGALLSEPIQPWSGTGLRNPEGPHLYHIGDWWYLLLAEGGTDRGHCVTVARSRTPQGPYEECPANPILTHRSTEHPVQSVGHADLVEGPEGRWYCVYHGTRPHGGFPQYHVLGRETMLAPVDWVDGWPVIVETDGLVTASDRSFTDSFEGVLDPRWVTPSGTLAGARVTDAGLELTASGAHRPVVTRVTDLDWTATVTLDVTRGRARVAVRLNDRHWFGLEVGPDAVHAVATIGPTRSVIASTDVFEPGHVQVRIAARVPAGGMGFPVPEPDLVSLEALANGNVRRLAALDGRYVSTEVAGGFTGRMVGCEALEGVVVVRSFAYEGLDGKDGGRDDS